MRKTGDFIHIISNEKGRSIYIIGRINNTIKKSGYKINLDQVSMILSSFNGSKIQ